MEKHTDQEIANLLEQLQQNIKGTQPATKASEAAKEDRNNESELLERLSGIINDASSSEIKEMADDSSAVGNEESSEENENDGILLTEDNFVSKDISTTENNDFEKESTIDADDIDDVVDSVNRENADAENEEDSVSPLLLSPEDDKQPENFSAVAQSTDSGNINDEEDAPRSAEEKEMVRKQVEKFFDDSLGDSDPFDIFDKIGKGNHASWITEDSAVPPQEETPVYDSRVSSSGINSGETYQFFSKENDTKKTTNLDITDINLALSMGSRDELEDSIGIERVRVAQNDFSESIEEEKGVSMIVPYSGDEFKSAERIREIKGKYKRKRAKLVWRFVGTSLLSLAILFVELSSLIEIDIPYVTAFLGTSFGYYVTSIALCAFCLLLSVGRFFTGLRSLLSFRADLYMPIAFLSLFNFAYQILALVMFPDKGLPTYNFVFAIFLIFAIADDTMKLRQEELTFDIVSREGDKLSLEKFDAGNKNASEKGDGSDFFVEKVSYVGHYYSRIGKRPTRYVDYFFEFLIALTVALFTTILSTYIAPDISYSFNTFIFTLFVCIPMQYLAIGSYPFYKLSKGLHNKDSAIIGDNVIEEYSDAGTVYLDETDMFGVHGVSAVGIRLYHSMELTEFLYYARSFYGRICVPLSHVFDNAIKSRNPSANVKIQSISSIGISATMDDDHSILYGNIDFMHENGFFPNENRTDVSKASDEKIFMQYFVIDGELAGLIYLKYTVSRRFEEFASEMVENQVKVGIRTMDPALNVESIKKIRSHGKDEVSVIRPSINDLIRVGKHSDSGIISARNSHMIFKILAQCFNIKKIHHSQKNIRILNIMLSVALSILIMAMKKYELVPSVFIVVYQSLWMLFSWIFTKSNLK